MAVAISCHAQSTNGNRLVEEGKTWNMKYHNYEAFDLYPDYDYKYFIKGDTLVGGKNCKKLYSYNEQNSDAVAYKMSMHETDGKVFFIPVNSTESFLLYEKGMRMLREGISVQRLVHFPTTVLRQDR